MRKLAQITTGLLCLSLLASCATIAIGGQDAETTDTSDTGIEGSTEKSNAIVFTDETKTSLSEDIISQFDVISDNYDYLRNDYLQYGEDSLINSHIAVTDLNHNGRLEVIITSCMGSGAFSITSMYEVSEDLTKLERLNINGETGPDRDADFVRGSAKEICTEIYECYMKDGKYYYLLTNYSSAGWAAKYIGYISYSFNGQIGKDFIGGCDVSVEMDTKKINTWLDDGHGNFFKDGESFAKHMTSYWDGYTKQKSCEVKYIPFPSKEAFAACIRDSYNAFNPDSEVVAITDYNYQKSFEGYYEDDYEYVIQETMPGI